MNQNKLIYNQLRSVVYDNNIKNINLEFKFMNLYMRKSRRSHNSKLIDCIDIAAVTVREDKRGQGYFKALLEELEKFNVNIYIENVMSEQFQNFFHNRDYLLHSQFPQEHEKGYDYFYKCFLKLEDF